MGISNRDGVSIFNAPVATKQLLFKLLGKYTKVKHSKESVPFVIVSWGYDADLTL